MFRFIANKRPAIAGLIIGLIIGLMVAGGYGGMSAWVCSGIRTCPASWQPFVLVSSIIFLIVFLIVFVATILFVRFYRILDTSTGSV
tara:strand:- start:307 stop:567 length:261 start_codon:yes stop_codon:yes gene_type:complete